MKYGLLDYTYTDSGFLNIGDHIQSLAAKQYLPKVDLYIDREKLNIVNQPIKIIMNGWYMHDIEAWPPSNNIDPLFVSFHLNPRAYRVLENEKVVEYLKNHAPIGCRDFSTQRILEDYGIETYYSFCLTSTLGQEYKSDEKKDHIIFNDVLHKYLPFKANVEFTGYINSLKLKLKNIKDYRQVIKRKNILSSYFPANILNLAIEYEQDQDMYLGRDGLFRKAEEVLKEYATARLVVTSRIHCAIPCLALGTPVLFMIDGVDDPDRDISRFDGILDHINILSKKTEQEINNIFGRPMNVIHPDDIDWSNPPQNPNTHHLFASKLIAKCEEFVR